MITTCAVASPFCKPEGSGQPSIDNLPAFLEDDRAKGVRRAPPTLCHALLGSSQTCDEVVLHGRRRRDPIVT